MPSTPGHQAIRKPGPIVEAACWAHGRCKFFDLARLNKAPIVAETVKRIDALFAIEREINGLIPQERLRVRQERSRSLIIELSCRHSSPPWIPAWTTTTLKTIPPGRAKASRFLLKEPPIIADRAMAAYRRNSTGPRTIPGKLRSSYNALRHGLAGESMTMGANTSLAGSIRRFR